MNVMGKEIITFRFIKLLQVTKSLQIFLKVHASFSTFFTIIGLLNIENHLYSTVNYPLIELYYQDMDYICIIFGIECAYEMEKNTGFSHKINKMNNNNEKELEWVNFFRPQHRFRVKRYNFSTLADSVQPY